MSMQPARVIVLGATSAMAEATARLYAAEGAALLLVGRNGERLAAISADLVARGAASAAVEVLDLAAPGAAAEAFPRFAAKLGGLDDVLIFYGILGDQRRAEHDLAHAREILQVNFLSAAEWCLAAAEALEAQQRGNLVVVGSVAGDRGRQSNYVYGAAKAGLAALVQGIAHRFAQRAAKGAARPRAVLVKPGFVDTPMTAGLKKGGPLWATPEAVARIVRRAAKTGGPTVYAPWFWRGILLVIRLVPAPIFQKLPL
jgi:NAD(P)-dependent dehydrogenase (short-subunit alcohol dehydrogenase family)